MSEPARAGDVLGAYEAVAVLETSSIARGFVVLDAITKRARVSVRSARAVSPGKFVTIFGGDVESVAESFEAAASVAESLVIDSLMLPGAHRQLLPALDNALVPRATDALLLVETTTICAAVLGADTALKAVDAAVVQMQLAMGIGGKAWFAVTGPLADIDALAELLRGALSEERCIAIERIAQPHPEMIGFLRG